MPGPHIPLPTVFSPLPDRPAPPERPRACQAAGGTEPMASAVALRGATASPGRSGVGAERRRVNAAGRAGLRGEVKKEKAPFADSRGRTPNNPHPEEARRAVSKDGQHQD
jgi:hypothetical protein